MNSISIGKIRGLQQIANPDGIFTMCAMDHRSSLQKMIDSEHPKEVGYGEMVKRKLELCSGLARHSSAVLLDPIYGAAQCLSHNALPSDVGLLVNVEASSYGNDAEQRLTQILEGWSVEKIRRMGASAAKLLLYYRPDLQPLARQQMDTVNRVAKECLKYDIPFLIEPKSYPVG
ncbi:tagatose-bisphosphate aldolase, partial [Chloroflexota bacterium]